MAFLNEKFMTHSYLTLMGIENWVSRSPLPGAKPTADYDVFQLLEQNKGVALLLLDKRKWQGNEAKANELLDAMLAAIGLKRSTVTADTDVKRYLIMGLALAKELVPDFNGPLMETEKGAFAATFHPADLLAQPQQKRQAWVDLQQIAKQWLNKSFQ